MGALRWTAAAANHDPLPAPEQTRKLARSIELKVGTVVEALQRRGLIISMCTEMQVSNQQSPAAWCWRISSSTHRGSSPLVAVTATSHTIDRPATSRYYADALTEAWRSARSHASKTSGAALLVFATRRSLESAFFV
jgi:hypothetical protein